MAADTAGRAHNNSVVAAKSNIFYFLLRVLTANVSALLLYSIIPRDGLIVDTFNKTDVSGDWVGFGFSVFTEWCKQTTGQ